MSDTWDDDNEGQDAFTVDGQCLPDHEDDEAIVFDDPPFAALLKGARR